jgi:FkbM family methyltransferase
MLKLIDPGWFVVDIGTHFGYEALLASKLVGEDGNVVCFEPGPATYQLALKNLKKPNIKINNKAVGDFNGTVKMQNRAITASAFNGISKNDADTHLIDVQLVSLDETFKSRNKPINFIKCDVEGFELEVLKGGVQILKEDKPILVLEADMPSTGRNKRGDEMAEFLSKSDYVGYSFA